MFISWDGYPSFTRTSIIELKKLKKERDNRKNLWIKLPCLVILAISTALSHIFEFYNNWKHILMHGNNNQQLFTYHFSPVAVR